MSRLTFRRELHVEFRMFDRSLYLENVFVLDRACTARCVTVFPLFSVSMISRVVWCFHCPGRLCLRTSWFNSIWLLREWVQGSASVTLLPNLEFDSIVVTVSKFVLVFSSTLTQVSWRELEGSESAVSGVRVIML